MSLDRFHKPLERMELSGVATTNTIAGCTPEEIDALEAKYGVTLPKTYALFLRLMGHNSYRLFAGDHISATYADVLEMTAEERRDLSELRQEGSDEVPPDFELPTDALLIAGRLGDQFQFIRCSEIDDSPVWDYNIDDWEVKHSHSSVMDWLEGWCFHAEQAIASGYYERRR